jgi:eukaryotic-like serine/threonine-protein kinase
VSQPAPVRREEPLFLGRFRALRPLGSGSSGSVWLARDERSGREVAVKVVPRAGKPGSRASREAQALAQLRHERCPRLYACGRDAQNVYIAREYVRGRTLREALRNRELTDRDAVEAAAQVLDGLAHAHERGIVHRDIKPANILLADEKGVSVRLLDFGLARVAELDTLTAAGDVPGTLAYIAPERLRGENASAAGDVWSVGVLLYEALAGGHPFWRPTLPETADAIVQGAQPLERLRPDLPRPLLAAVDRALSLDPARRPPAGKLAAALRRSHHARSETLGRLDTLTAPAARLVPPALAGIYAGAGATVLPFFPAHWSALLAVAVAATTFFAPRAGLAAALAVPLLPLGNVALALALLYGLAAAAWLAVHAREPERGPLVVVGPLLGPFSALLPLAFYGARGAVVRGVGVGSAILLAEAVRAVRAGPVGLGLPGMRDPVAAAETVARAVPQTVLVEAAALAVAAVALPYAARQGRWGLAAWGGATLCIALLPVPFLPLALAVWLTCGVLAVKT